MKLDTRCIYAISKIDWIKKHQNKFQAQERETRREYLDRESHYVWGRRYLLKVQEANRPPSVELKHNAMILTVRPGTVMSKREAVVMTWYREQVCTAVMPLIGKWEAILGVKANRTVIRRMRTRWGSCTPTTDIVLVRILLHRRTTSTKNGRGNHHICPTHVGMNRCLVVFPSLM